MKLKHCGPCGEWKPATLEFFHRNRSKPDLLATECKACATAAAKRRYARFHVEINAAKKDYWAARYQREKALRQSEKGEDCLLSLTSTELAYIAGLIDGEGSFGVCKVKSPSRYVPVMSISMTCGVTIGWLSTKFGTTCNTVKSTAIATGQCRTQYLTRINGKRLVLLCSMALPYFITRRAHAEQILRFGETYIAQRGNGQRHPEWVFAERASIKLMLHHLNRPHIYAPPPPGASVDAVR